jgi:hypothetical protein
VLVRKTKIGLGLTVISYVSRGSPQGHEVQHWLAAEAQLLAERKLTQVHGFQNRMNFPGNPILLVKQ